jgi:alanyl aminopeptidase
MFRQMARETTAELTYDWMIENDEAIIDMIPEMFRSNIVPALGSYFCSADKAEEWEIFVNSHADRLPGYERDLAQATESIQLCAALKQAQSADLLAVLQGYQ